jgi:EmrB/QacA subfamily drug resistance transporter
MDSVGQIRTDGWHRMLVEPRRPEAIRRRPNAFWLAVATVCIGAFMGQLDASIVTVALPTLQRSFHASVGEVTWVGLSYLLVLVATVAAVGRFADMWGHKLLYIYGFGLFVLGSVLCGLAPSLGALIAFRAVQAVGAALLQANSVAIIVLAVPKRSLGGAIGIQGAAQAVGLALGPTVGGLLLAAGGWRLIFFVTVPFGLVGMLAGLWLVPRSRHLQAREPFDWTGLALFFPAVVAIFAAISFGSSLGWTSGVVVGLVVVGACLVTAFVARERRCRMPLLDLGLFRRRRFTAGIVSGMLSYLVLFGVLFVVPFYLERGLRLGSGRAGLELMAMPLALGVIAPAAGRLADRLGPRLLTMGGMVLVALGLGALSTVGRSTVGFVGLLAAVGVGLGCFTPPNNATIMASVPRQQAGLASGVLNMSRGMGTALGLALTGLVFDVAGGHSLLPPDARHAFSVAVMFLASVALVAAGVAGLGEGGHGRLRSLQLSVGPGLRPHDEGDPAPLRSGSTTSGSSGSLLLGCSRSGQPSRFDRPGAPDRNRGRNGCGGRTLGPV